ncbi:hypothetical protein NDU88_006938 [Pleurodeles waltl]|uniref:Uncharacterized protein n=1 Tax=Pleurodeles waltl TaxID=8319 RepID=A0AAV7N5I1_PLEWA|nr:hypothetical protein NDU88_006938 [Pleurodeles waltl]
MNLVPIEDLIKAELWKFCKVRGLTVKMGSTKQDLRDGLYAIEYTQWNTASTVNEEVDDPEKEAEEDYIAALGREEPFLILAPEQRH